ncbi:hypothetical protein [Kutzneria kofuensis]|uniref:hypothetical protein n=1 Tax=Kutzneria kofuensis TaxID=103725 RepID=UPI0031EE2179
MNRLGPLFVTVTDSCTGRRGVTTMVWPAMSWPSSVAVSVSGSSDACAGVVPARIMPAARATATPVRRPIENSQLSRLDWREMLPPPAAHGLNEPQWMGTMRFLVRTVTLLALCVGILAPVTAMAATAPVVSVTPTSGPAGSQFTIHWWSGFTQCRVITFTWAGAPLASGSPGTQGSVVRDRSGRRQGRHVRDQRDLRQGKRG